MKKKKPTVIFYFKFGLLFICMNIFERHFSLSWSRMNGPCLLRRRKSTEEEDRLGFIVSNEENEGVVGCKVFLPQHTESHHACRCCSCLCTFLIHLHKGFVHHCGQEESSLTIHTRQVGLGPTKNIRHAQFGQRLVKLVIFLQFEFGQVDKDFWVDVHVFPVGPFIQLLPT